MALVADLVFLILLVDVGISASLPGPGALAVVLIGLVLSGAYLLWRRTEAPPLPAHLGAVLCFCLLSSAWRFPSLCSPGCLGFLFLSSLLGAWAVILALVDRRRGVRWTDLRLEGTWSLLVLCAASTLTTLITRLVIARNNTVDIAPGQILFLPLLWGWAGVWLGMDRAARGPEPGFADRRVATLYRLRYLVCLGACCLVMGLRSWAQWTLQAH